MEPNKKRKRTSVTAQQLRNHYRKSFDPGYADLDYACATEINNLIFSGEKKLTPRILCKGEIDCPCEIPEPEHAFDLKPLSNDSSTTIHIPSPALAVSVDYKKAIHDGEPHRKYDSVILYISIKRDYVLIPIPGYDYLKLKVKEKKKKVHYGIHGIVEKTDGQKELVVEDRIFLFQDKLSDPTPPLEVSLCVYDFARFRTDFRSKVPSFSLSVYKKEGNAPADRSEVVSFYIPGFHSEEVLTPRVEQLLIQHCPARKIQEILDTSDDLTSEERMMLETRLAIGETFRGNFDKATLLVLKDMEKAPLAIQVYKQCILSLITRSSSVNKLKHASEDMSFESFKAIKTNVLLDASQKLREAWFMRENSLIQLFFDISLDLALADMIVEIVSLGAMENFKVIWGEQFPDYSREVLVKYAKACYDRVIDYHRQNKSTRAELYRNKRDEHCKILLTDSVDRLRVIRKDLMNKYKSGDRVERFLLAAQVRICELSSEETQEGEAEEGLNMVDKISGQLTVKQDQWTTYCKKLFRSFKRKI